jgi:hypothetical protein
MNTLNNQLDDFDRIDLVCLLCGYTEEGQYWDFFDDCESQFVSKFPKHNQERIRNLSGFKMWFRTRYKKREIRIIEDILKYDIENGLHYFINDEIEYKPTSSAEFCVFFQSLQKDFSNFGDFQYEDKTQNPTKQEKESRLINFINQFYKFFI